MSVFIEGNKVRIDPAAIGAGTIEVIVANSARRPQRVVLRAASGRFALLTTPISQGESGKAQAIVEPGVYTLRARPSGNSARLWVGPKRPDSNNQLITP